MSDIRIVVTDWQAAPKSVAARQEIFAIGDIHGMASLLEALLAGLAGVRMEETSHLISLGDLFDRGPQSRDVLAIARNPSRYASWATSYTVLCGNHDHFLVAALAGDKEAYGAWLLNGGIQTLQSFGIKDGWATDAIPRMRDALTDEDRRFLHLELEVQQQIGDYVFVHAGWNPDLDPDEQTDKDRLRIREPFLSAAAGPTWPHPVAVVHGHTIEVPAVHAHRIGVDSGAHATGVLTAVQLHGDHARFIQAIDGSPCFAPHRPFYTLDPLAPGKPERPGAL